MTEFTVELAGRAGRSALFGEWRRQLESGHLTEAGLLALRTRLTVPGEFEPGNDLALLILEVEQALGMDREVNW